MWPELKNVARREARNWLIAAIVAVAYAAMAGSCTPQAAEAVAVYERMSDQERMRGVVLEPVGE